jgi:hypothetical protein
VSLARLYSSNFKPTKLPARNSYQVINIVTDLTFIRRQQHNEYDGGNTRSGKRTGKISG